MVRRAVPIFIATALVLGSCTSDGGGDDSEGLVEVTATYALAEGETQSPDQLGQSCDAASELVNVYAPVLVDPASLTADELRAQVAGLGALAMDVHRYAPFEQQDEVTALTRLVELLDQRLGEFDYDWHALEASDFSFIEMLRREGIDTSLSGLMAWVLVNCPEGTVQIEGVSG